MLFTFTVFVLRNQTVMIGSESHRVQMGVCGGGGGGGGGGDRCRVLGA